MLGALAAAGTKALGGARFSLVNLLPSTLLVTFFVVLAMSGAYVSDDASVLRVVREVADHPGWAVVAGFGTFLAAVLIRPFQTALVQLLEGYWEGSSALRYAADVATERHRRVKHTAEVIAQAINVAEALHPRPRSRRLGHVVDHARLHGRINTERAGALTVRQRYPLPITREAMGRRAKVIDDRLMPTLLGNVLRDGEDNAGRRYGLDITVAYPRMYPFLSHKLDAAIGQSLDLIDTLSALCVVSAVAAVGSIPLVSRPAWWPVTPFVAFALAVLSYSGAVRTARGHGVLLATAMDLHRFDMLRALHYRLPRTALAEQRLNEELSSFLDGRNTAVQDMRRVRYEHAAPEGTGSSSPGATTDGSDG